MNAALRETKDSLANTLMEVAKFLNNVAETSFCHLNLVMFVQQLKVEQEIKALVNDLAYLKMNLHTKETEVREKIFLFSFMHAKREIEGRK